MATMDLAPLDTGFVEEFWRLRRQLFAELGEIQPDSDTSALKTATCDYYLQHINQDLFCWGIQAESRLVSIASICLFSRIPYEENLTGREAYLLNVYTCPQYRQNGLAKKLLTQVISWAKEQGIRRLWLNSSEKGRELYSRLGFLPKGNEMELFLS